jgi:hypothetical protein
VAGAMMEIEVKEEILIQVKGHLDLVMLRAHLEVVSLKVAISLNLAENVVENLSQTPVVLAVEGEELINDFLLNIYVTNGLLV